MTDTLVGNVWSVPSKALTSFGERRTLSENTVLHVWELLLCCSVGSHSVFSAEPS